MWIARSKAWTPLNLLSFRSGTMAIPSSMKSSIRPISSFGMWMSKVAAGANGIAESRYMGGSSFAACGENNSCGFHSLQWSMSLAKSVHSSDATHHSFGQGDPPKVSRKLNNPKSWHMIAHFAAVSPFRVTLL